MSLISQPVYLASAAIRPGRVVAASTTVKRSALESTAKTELPIGISKNAYKYAPGSHGQVAYPYTAEVGDAIPYSGEDQVCLAMAGAAITDLSLPLTTDGSGRVISYVPGSPPGSGVIWFSVGMPLELAAAAGDLIQIRVMIRAIQVA